MRHTDRCHILVNLQSLIVEKSRLVIVFKALVHKREVVQAAGIDGVVLAEVALDQLHIRRKTSNNGQSLLRNHETLLIVLFLIELVDLCLLLAPNPSPTTLLPISDSRCP